MDKFCENCGYKLNANDKFCEKCGSKIEEKDKPKKATLIENNMGENINNNGSNTLFCIIGIIVVIIIIFGVISIFSHGGGIADIQEVYMKKPVSGHGMYNTQNGWKPIPGGTTFSIRFVPHQDILHYQNVRLVNGAIRYNNGTEAVFDNQDMNLGLDYENSELPTQSSLYQDSWYTFTFKYSGSTKKIEQISHLSGDLVVDTTTEQNILLAHVDNDVIIK